MSVYINLEFCAKLTDFGYEVIQEIYKNKPYLPVILGNIEDYDDEGNRLYSDLEKICFKHEREDFIEFYNKSYISDVILFGRYPSYDENKPGSILTKNKTWILNVYFDYDYYNDILHLLTYVVSEPVEIKSKSDNDDDWGFGYSHVKKPLIINPDNIRKPKELDIINGRIVGRR